MDTEINLNKPELLDVEKHDRSTFTCGVEQLDVYLKEKARKEAPEIALTFVVTSVEQPSVILGYYSLSSTNLRTDDLPEEVRKKLPRYDSFGATLLGRLAVAEKYQHGEGKQLRIGELLLMDAKLQAWKASRKVASYALVVKVLKGDKGDPTAFYRRYGFLPCDQTENLMYLPMKTIEKTLKSAGLTS